MTWGRSRPARTPTSTGEPASLLILRWKPSHEELLAFFEEHDNIYV